MTTSLPALAGTLDGMHAAFTARHFEGAVLFDALGRELARAGSFGAPPLRLQMAGAEASIEGLPAGLRARTAALSPYGTTCGHLALLESGATSRDGADAAARFAAELSSRLATLDYEIENLSREVAESYEAISLLFEVTGASARSGSREALAHALLEQVRGNVRCRGAVLLLDPAGEQGPARDATQPARVLATVGEVRELAAGGVAARAGAVGEWLAARGPSVLDDVGGFLARFADDPVARNATSSLLVAPLCAGERGVGCIVLFDRLDRGRFDSRDLKLVDAVAAHAGAMLLGLRMAELSKEMEIGRRIQQSLLPSSLPSVAGLDVASRCAMAHAMGGDFYDAVASDGRLRAVIADVSGHDLGAALFMAAARAQFHAELLGRRGPGALSTRMNALLHSDLARAGLYATYFALSIDPRRGTLRFASGGHNPALLLHAAGGGVELLEATGTPLGIVPDARIAERSRRLAPGDLVLLYTDGLTETAAPDGSLFGEERLADALARRRGLRAQEILAGIEEEIARFRGGAAATDDGTALLIQVEGPVRPKTG